MTGEVITGIVSVTWLKACTDKRVTRKKQNLSFLILKNLIDNVLKDANLNLLVVNYCGGINVSKQETPS
jgi:hypothetical protein